MRHRKKVNHLGRKSAHRQAMLSNMATSLILHKRIKTTLQKAKALRIYVEPLINRSKDNTTHSRRIVFSYLQSKEAVTELFRSVADKIGDRPGGYTRILKIENRLGDNAEMCYIELVDFNENMLKKTEAETKKSATRRAGKKSSGKSETTEKQKAEAPMFESSRTDSPITEETPETTEPEATEPETTEPETTEPEATEPEATEPETTEPETTEPETTEPETSQEEKPEEA